MTISSDQSPELKPKGAHLEYCTTGENNRIIVHLSNLQQFVIQSYQHKPESEPEPITLRYISMPQRIKVVLREYAYY